MLCISLALNADADLILLINLEYNISFFSCFGVNVMVQSRFGNQMHADVDVCLYRVVKIFVSHSTLLSLSRNYKNVNLNVTNFYHLESNQLQKHLKER